MTTKSSGIDQAETQDIAPILPAGWCTLGVGNGPGRLFVHGDYDSIKAAQQLILRPHISLALHWTSDGEYHHLFLGQQDNPVAWLRKRKKHYSAYIDLPYLKPWREYDTFENQKADVEAKVRAWFEAAYMAG